MAAVPPVPPPTAAQMAALAIREALLNGARLTREMKLEAEYPPVDPLLQPEDDDMFLVRYQGAEYLVTVERFDRTAGELTRLAYDRPPTVAVRRRRRR